VVAARTLADSGLSAVSLPKELDDTGVWRSSAEGIKHAHATVGDASPEAAVEVVGAFGRELCNEPVTLRPLRLLRGS
jgi:hypothetical protein